MKRIIRYLKDDHDRRTLILSSFSIIIPLSFAIYNGIFGFVNESIWHISILFYYILLMGIKSLLVISEFHNKNKNTRKQYITVWISYIILIIINIAMIAPAVLMIQNQREYNLGMIPAIAIATYTTYSITLSIINLNKAKNNKNIVVKQIRLINLINACMSVLLLQNTLIVAMESGYSNGMKALSSITTIVILLIIAIMVIYTFVKTINDNIKCDE